MPIGKSFGTTAGSRAVPHRMLPGIHPTKAGIRTATGSSSETLRPRRANPVRSISARARSITTTGATRRKPGQNRRTKSRRIPARTPWRRSMPLTTKTTPIAMPGIGRRRTSRPATNRPTHRQLPEAALRRPRGNRARRRRCRSLQLRRCCLSRHKCRLRHLRRKSRSDGRAGRTTSRRAAARAASAGSAAAERDRRSSTCGARTHTSCTCCGGSTQEHARRAHRRETEVAHSDRSARPGRGRRTAVEPRRPANLAGESRPRVLEAEAVTSKPRAAKKPDQRQPPPTSAATPPETDRSALQRPRATRPVASTSQPSDDWLLLLALTLFGLSVLAFSLAAVSEVGAGAAALTMMRSRLGSKGLSARRVGVNGGNDGAASSREPDSISYRD